MFFASYSLKEVWGKGEEQSPLVLMVFLHGLQNSIKHFPRLTFSDSFLSIGATIMVLKKHPLLMKTLSFLRHNRLP